MKALAAILAAVTLTTSEAPHWQDTLTPKKAGDFPALRPLKARYKFGWAAIPAGYAEAEFTRKNNLLQLHAVGGTTGIPRGLWRLDADATSTVEPGSLLTTRLVQMEHYSDEKRTTTVIFGPDGASRSRVREPEDKDKGKVKRFKFSPVRDLHGALLFVRSQRLRDGDVIRFVVYPNASAYLAEVRVFAHEKLNIGGKAWPAIKLGLKLQDINKRLELKPDEKLKSAFGWLSDDKDRLLLKVDSEVFIGKVWMELQQVEFLDKRS